MNLTRSASAFRCRQQADNDQQQRSKSNGQKARKIEDPPNEGVLMDAVNVLRISQASLRQGSGNLDYYRQARLVDNIWKIQERWDVPQRLSSLEWALIQFENNLWGAPCLSQVVGIPTLLANLIVALRIQIASLRESGLMHPAAICVACRVLGEEIVKDFSVQHKLRSDIKLKWMIQNMLEVENKKTRFRSNIQVGPFIDIVRFLGNGTVHQLDGDAFMYDDNTGFNTAMISVLYLTRALQNYEPVVPLEGGNSQYNKTHHVNQMNVLRQFRAAQVTAAQDALVSGNVKFLQVKTEAAKAQEMASVAQHAAAAANIAASQAAIAQNNSKAAADHALVVKLAASNLEMQLRNNAAQESVTALHLANARTAAAAAEEAAAQAKQVAAGALVLVAVAQQEAEIAKAAASQAAISENDSKAAADHALTLKLAESNLETQLRNNATQETITSYQLANARTVAAAAEKAAAEEKQVAAAASALASAAETEAETAKATASEAAISENNSKAAADRALVLRLDASNLEMQLDNIASQQRVTALQVANARTEAAAAEEAAARAKQEASTLSILAAAAETKAETARAKASEAKIAADQAEADINTEQQRQRRSLASLALRQEVAKIAGLQAAIDLANANTKELDAKSNAALAEATRLSKQTAAQKAKEDTEDRILRLELRKRLYDASPEGLAAAEGAKKLAAAMAADHAALAAAANQLAAATAAKADAAIKQQLEDQAAVVECQSREAEDRKWTHGVLEHIPWAPKLCVGFLLFLMLILMSTNLQLITQLASSTTLSSARAGLLGLVLSEGGAWFLWMFYIKGWTLNDLFARCTRRQIHPTPDPEAGVAATQPTLPDDWFRSRMSRGLLTCMFLLIAGPVTSIYMLLGLFFWDLIGSQNGLASPTMMTRWQTTHLALLRLCTQGTFLVVPSLVISSFVVSSTVCPSTCSQASSGISLCNTDPASVQLLQLLPCSAATCGVLTNGAADTTTCFLDARGRTAAQSSLAFSVMSLVGYIVMGILVLIFRSNTALKECFRLVFECRISMGRGVPV